MSIWSVNLTKLFRGRLRLGSQYFVHTLSLVTENIPSWITERRRMTIENISWSTSTKELGPDRTHDPCISNRTHYRLLYMAKSFWGSYFIQIDPESINSVFALFQFFWSHTIWIIDCWAHWPGLSVRCIRGIRRGFGEQGKCHLFQGNRGIKAKFRGEQRQYWGTGNIRKQKLREQRSKPIYFRGTRKHVPIPLTGLRISLRRQNTTKVMAYNITRNSPL